MAVTIIGADGKQAQVELNGMSFYREAMDKKVSVRQLVNSKYPTAASGPDAFQQMCASAGLRFRADEHTGTPSANLRDILDPSLDAAGSYVNAPAVPDSRILFPAALMEVIEDKLQGTEDVATGAFENLVGYRQTVSSPRIEQPVISYSGAGGPENSQFQAVAQNARPPIMLSIKASDISRKIPTTAIGMEISREALAQNSLDFVAMTLARFFKIANYNEWVTQIGYLLNGDPDAAVNSMSAGTSALATFTATSLDAACTGANTMTQKAWLAFLYKNSMTMTKTNLICDFNAAMAIENRANRPTNVMNNSIDRIDVPFRVTYPSFNSTIDMLIMPVGTFPASTILSLDKSQAIAKVTSTAAEYQAIEEMVIKKSTEIRIDRGFITYRMYDSAFNCMVMS